MNDDNSNSLEVCRSTEANLALIGLLVLTLGFPLGSSWLRQKEATRLSDLMADGQVTTGRIVSSSYQSRGGIMKYWYRFSMNGQSYGSSFTVSVYHNSYRDGGTVPIFYYPGNPDNHIVGSSLTQDEIDNRLVMYNLWSFLGPIAALIALFIESQVYRQMSLARSGRLANGTVTDYRLFSKGRKFRIEYTFSTPDGTTASGHGEINRAAAAGILPRGPVPILYNPIKPRRNMMIRNMWAVHWRANPTQDGRQAA